VTGSGVSDDPRAASAACEISDIGGHLIEAVLPRFARRPCHVRGEEQIRYIRIEQRVIVPRRLVRQDVDSRAATTSMLLVPVPATATSLSTGAPARNSRDNSTLFNNTMSASRMRSAVFASSDLHKVRSSTAAFKPDSSRSPLDTVS
jgi:hypothetical protein